MASPYVMEEVKSHTGSTVAWQRSSNAESGDGRHAAYGFDLYLLHMWGLVVFLRFRDIELLEILLGIICVSFQEYRF